ncbi:helix-turn-helix domain-containing protein [Lacticaseibacillus hegangensis]|uniref:Helix-turn-helix domain-containing protein n=1 Tax=Lacticaseibacillus hegangensis TaxID=2486010 RepID=A0ABW4CZC0_9LACO|nr:helix-turn-helix transcriptional regulator [Lacticaseibacillus hegangensis]
MTLFERVKETSNNRGWSLQQTAQKAGLGINSLYSWKKKRPSVERIQAVADVLNVSVDYLIGNTDNPIPAPKTGSHKPTDLADEDIILSFEGKQIPPEDLETIRRFLRGGKDEHKR